MNTSEQLAEVPPTGNSEPRRANPVLRLQIICALLLFALFIALTAIELITPGMQGAFMLAWLIIAATAAGAPVTQPRSRRSLAGALPGFLIAGVAVLAMVPINNNFQNLRLDAWIKRQCTEQFAAMGRALAEYAANHGGHYPPTIAQLGISHPGVTTIRGSREIVDADDVKSDQAYYLYAGGRPTPAGAADPILMYEVMENHGTGIHVLYASGRVAWLKAPAATKLLTTLEAEKPNLSSATTPRN